MQKRTRVLRFYYSRLLHACDPRRQMGRNGILYTVRCHLMPRCSTLCLLLGGSWDI